MGEYVEDFNEIKKKLSISVWSGHVALTDLKIKNNIFQKLNLPFDMKLGIIKKLDLNVPYARLSSSPVVVSIDKIYLIITP